MNGMDIFTLGDFLNQREAAVSSPEIPLEVRPLPDKGKPESFGGAIGKFGMIATVDPNAAKTGEPLTLKTKVSGEGNFGRVGAPMVKASESDWKLYPATSSFAENDDLGLEGVKSFEQLIIPQKPTTQLPPIEFSYFDPYDEKYVVLKPDEIPIDIVGAPITPTPDQPAKPGPQKADDRKDTGVPSVPALITEYPGGPQDVRPLFQRAVYWAAQTVPLGVVLALLALAIRQWSRENPSGRAQLSAQRRELAEAQAAMAQPGTSIRQAYGAARRVLLLQLRQAGAGDIPDSQLEERLLGDPKLPQDLKEDVAGFFERQAEVTYSGQGGESPVPAEEQALLAEFTRRVAAAL
jgi:hypothetical protein